MGKACGDGHVELCEEVALQSCSLLIAPCTLLPCLPDSFSIDLDLPEEDDGGREEKDTLPLHDQAGRFTGKTPEARLRQGLGYTKSPHRQPPAETPRPAAAGWRGGCRCAAPQPSARARSAPRRL